MDFFPQLIGNVFCCVLCKHGDFAATSHCWNKMGWKKTNLKGAESKKATSTPRNADQTRRKAH